jgi:hypothetical protein
MVFVILNYNTVLSGQPLIGQLLMQKNVRMGEIFAEKVFKSCQMQQRVADLEKVCLLLLLLFLLCKLHAIY